MYRIFCESIDNYFLLNQGDEAKLKVAEVLKLFAIITEYKRLKSQGDILAEEAENLVYQINIKSL